MIKAKLSNGDLLFGLSKGNIELLQQGKPIVINLKDMGLENRRVMIMYGETEDKIFEELTDFMDLEKTKVNFDTKDGSQG
jgi:hypothetical protein